MIRIRSLAIVLVLVPRAAFAQPTDADPTPPAQGPPAIATTPAPPPPPPREHGCPHGCDPRAWSGEPYAWGGLGFFAPGLLHGSFHFFDEVLGSPGALGPGWAPSDTGFSLGSVGGGLLGSRVWIGGKGSGFWIPTETSDRGRATIGGGAGSFELGVAVVNRPHMLFIPYLGFGGVGASVEVRNRSGAPMNVGSTTIAPGQSKTYDLGIPTIDAGVRVIRVGFERAGGFAFGVDVGIVTSVVPRAFEADGQTLNGLPPGRFTAGTLKLLFGGGGFAVPSSTPDPK